jgi:hypothetical protein
VVEGYLDAGLLEPLSVTVQKNRKYPAKGGVGFTFSIASIIVCIIKNIGLQPASIVWGGDARLWNINGDGSR